ncbi:oxygenase MpaB family protein [Glutamicibacter sp. JC586]|uniref:oxygenase MpaB family protein n=1 Tax=Glutamicibacter sp. JC586 TaxID=2590552 RepID=UPI00135A0432|nr:oxygenase MpaB family protein [Glutamicibacter sp. JC586]
MDQDAKENEQTNAFSRIAPEAGLLLGAGRAILMQLAHPQIGLAIDKHSDFASNPLSRLIHTLGYIYALSNGTAEQQRTMINYVNAAHRNVHSPRDLVKKTPAYSALDPKLQLWVAATLFDSARVIAAQVLPGDIQHNEALYRQYTRLGRALQMPSTFWPATLGEFDQYVIQTQEKLCVNERIRALADELFTGRNAPWWIRWGLPLIRDVTIAQLPTGIREQFGFVLSRKIYRRNAAVIRVVRWATRILPVWIRHLPMRLMLRRIDQLAQD